MIVLSSQYSDRQKTVDDSFMYELLEDRSKLFPQALTIKSGTLSSPYIMLLVLVAPEEVSDAINQRLVQEIYTPTHLIPILLT
jgi:hypothetical protein